MILHAEAYDPTEPDDKPKSSHISKKDLKWAVILVVLLVVVLWPVWVKLKFQRDKHVCKDNLGQIARALQLYAVDNSDRLPPAYVAGDNFEPKLFNGMSVSWMTLIAGGVRNFEENFTCPAAQDSELAPNAGPKNELIKSGYGLFGAVSAAPLANIPNQSSVAMVAETASMGARDTFNPLPMKDSKGNPVPDGYVIGFDNSNFLPSDSTMDILNKSKYASRLAFYNTASGAFSETGEARHPGGIHILFVDMHVETLPPPAAIIRRMGAEGSEIIKTWAVR
jgi:prepilin-type processing-associated H-X9-DG protein